MLIQRIGLGGLVLGIASILLFIDMFLPWFGFDFVFDEDDTTFSAWQWFDFIHIVLFATVLLGLAVPVVRWLRWRPPFAISFIATPLAVLALVMVLFRVLDPGAADTEREVGLFFGILILGGIIAGGVLALREEGTSLAAEANRIAQKANQVGGQGGFGQQGGMGPGQQGGQGGFGQQGGFGPGGQQGGFGPGGQQGMGPGQQAAQGGFGQQGGPGPVPQGGFGPQGQQPGAPAQQPGPGPGAPPQAQQGPGPLGGAPPAPDPGTAATPAAGPPANWYPDPYGERRLRYWDGASWTDRSSD